MKRPQPPLFLERRAYRRRRAMDAARLLPVVGAVLLLIPLLWAPQLTEAPDTAVGGQYIFAVWLGLIVAAFLVTRKLGGEPGSPGGSPGSSPRSNDDGGPD